MQAGVIRFEGRDGPFDTDWRSVSPDYSRAMGVPFLAGRTFSESDRRTGRHRYHRRAAREGSLRNESPIATVPDRLPAPHGSRSLALSVIFVTSDSTGIRGHRSTGDISSAPRTGWPWLSKRPAILPRSLRPCAPRSAKWTRPAALRVRPMTVMHEQTLRGEWVNSVLVGLFAALAPGTGQRGPVWRRIVFDGTTTARVRHPCGGRRERHGYPDLGGQAGLWLALVGSPRLHTLCTVDSRARGHAPWGECVGHLDVPPWCPV